MMYINKKVLTAGFIVAAACSMATSNGFAQETAKGTVVVYPVVFNHDGGSKGSRDAAIQAVNESLQKSGYTLISDTVAENTWNRMELVKPKMDQPTSLENIVRFGREMKAHYVVTPTFNFYSRSIWVLLGPRTISNATVDVVITDVETEKVVYSKQNVVGRSDEKADALKIAADVLVTPLVTVVSGGPKTPQEERAVRIAVARAMRGWVRKTEREGPK